MSLISEVKSWLWILKIWIPLYPALLFIGIIIGISIAPAFYWSSILLGVPLVVIPVTYRNLVGGGCSVRFQICALVKGMLAGAVLFLLSLLADPIIWQTLSSVVGWNPLNLGPGISENIYFVWFFSGVVGGFGARIVEVRGMHTEPEISIAGFE